MGFPDRFTLDKSDERYRNDAHLFVGRIAVTVDGEDQHDVITYDVPAGEVIKYARDRNGWPVIVNGKVARVAVRGRVELRLQTYCERTRSSRQAWT